MKKGCGIAMSGRKFGMLMAVGAVVSITIISIACCVNHIVTIVGSVVTELSKTQDE